MYQLRRKLFSQNFLHDPQLVKKLVGSSSLVKNDLVLEIGPGRGIITEQLIKTCKYTLAVEIDRYWYHFLQNKFGQTKNITLYNQDFLHVKLPSMPYKVFANIPFAIEGKIIRRLIEATNPPTDAYLVMMKELAYRLSAPHKENLFSIMHKPWFVFSIYHHFKPTDFTPVPSVQSVMLRFTKRKEPLLPWKEKTMYQMFIHHGFGQGTPTFYNLKKRFGHQRVLYVYTRIGINKNTKPSYISLQQWIQLYKALQ
jgi:23S rRNA (adenine-N6)-dimethyltransferase